MNKCPSPLQNSFKNERFIYFEVVYGNEKDAGVVGMAETKIEEFVKKLEEFSEEEFEDRLNEEEFIQFIEENIETFEKTFDLLFDTLLEYIFIKRQEQENIRRNYEVLHYAVVNTQYRAIKLLRALDDLKDRRVIATSELSLFKKEL